MSRRCRASRLRRRRLRAVDAYSPAEQCRLAIDDAADHRADDADEALVGAADEQVLQVRRAVELLFGRAVDRAVLVPGEAANRRRREHVGVDHAAAEVGHEAHGRRRPSDRTSCSLAADIPLSASVCQRSKLASAVMRITSLVQRLARRRKLFGRADHAAAHVDQLVRLFASGTSRESLKNTIVRSQPNARGSRVEHRDRLRRTKAARRARRRRGSLSSHSRIVSNQPADESTLPAVQLRCRRRARRRDARPSLDLDPLHARPQPQLAAQLLELAAPGSSGSAARPRTAGPSPSRKMLRNMMQNWPEVHVVLRGHCRRTSAGRTASRPAADR